MRSGIAIGGGAMIYGMDAEGNPVVPLVDPDGTLLTNVSKTAGAGDVLVSGAAGEAGVEDLTNGHAVWLTGHLETADTKTFIIPATDTPHATGMYRITVANHCAARTLATAIVETIDIGGASVDSPFAAFADQAIAAGASKTEVTVGLGLQAKIILTLSGQATTLDHAFVRVEQV